MEQQSRKHSAYAAMLLISCFVMLLLNGCAQNKDSIILPVDYMNKIEQIVNVSNRQIFMARIMLLLCYVKRRCNLFFREKESETLPADEITVYVDELAEMAYYSNIKTIVTCVLKTQLPVRLATLFYDFFYNVIHWASWLDDPTILVHFGSEDGYCFTSAYC